MGIDSVIPKIYSVTANSLFLWGLNFSMPSSTVIPELSLKSCAVDVSWEHWDWVPQLCFNWFWFPEMVPNVTERSFPVER